MQEFNQKDKTAKASKTAKLKLSNGRLINVKVIGEDKFGTYNGKDYVCPVYSSEAIDWLVDRINLAVSHNFDQTILITGKERIGKTTLGFQLATKLCETGGPDKEFPLENVTFTQEDFRERVRKVEPESVVMLDEAGAAMFSREWMLKGQRELIKSFMIFGIKRLKIILILPHITMLDYQLRNRRVHWWLSCYSGSYERGLARLRRAEESEWRLNTWWDPRFGLRFHKFGGSLWDEYEKRKLQFIDEQLAGKYAMTVREKKYKAHIDKIVIKMEKEGHSNEEIARFTELGIDTVRSILKKAEIG